MTNKYFYNLSVALFGLIILTFLISSIGLALHIPVNILYIIIPIFLAIFYLKKFSQTKDDFLKQLLEFLLIVLFSYYLSLFFWDYSWDGKSYHMASIIMLKKGWLPIYDNLPEVVQKFVIYPFNANFSEIYPKFCEITGANFYKITGYIESSKTANFILLFSVFMYSYTVFKKFITKNIACIVFSLLVCINPICICEMFTNLVDLHIYFAFVFLLLTVLKIEKTKTITNIDKFVIIGSSLMLPAIKLTGIAYLTVIYFCWGIYLIIEKKEIKYLVKTSIIVALLTLITCINPYITNFKNYGHPFHPVMGKNKIDVITKEYPRGFSEKSTLERFLISTFSESSNSIERHPNQALNVPVNLKIPFTILKNSPLRSFKVADMRVGGFGYYWSGILCLTFLLLLFLRFNLKEDKKLFLLALSMILFTVISNPHSWWARFVPQLWLLPIFLIMFSSADLRNFAKTRKFISYVCIFFIILNSVIVFQHQLVFNLKYSCYNRQFFDMVEQQSRPNGIYFMRNTDFKGKLADETILPHLEERHIKLIKTEYDRNKVIKENFLSLQLVPVYDFYYFYKPVLIDNSLNK